MMQASFKFLLSAGFDSICSISLDFIMKFSRIYEVYEVMKNESLKTKLLLKKCEYIFLKSKPLRDKFVNCIGYGSVYSIVCAFPHLWLFSMCKVEYFYLLGERFHLKTKQNKNS